MPNNDFSKISIGGVDIPITDDVAQSRLDALEGKVPTQATSQNQLADKDFVNSSIATATATHRGTFNLVSDLSLTVAATQAQIATALGTAVSTADNNDYAFVQIPTTDATPTEIARVERYKYNGTAWSFEYALNNSGFTSAQWTALNSGITSGLVSKLNDLPTNSELTTLLGGKANSSHTHTKSEITDFAHNHDDRYYTESETDDKILTETNRAKNAEENLQKSVSEIGRNLSYAIDSIISDFTLEGSSSTTFTVNNQGAAARYIDHMGGYMWYKKDGKWYAAKLSSLGWNAFADGTEVTTAIENVCETMIRTPKCHYKGSGKTLNFGGLTPVDDGHFFEAAPWNGAYPMSVDGSGVGHSRPNTTPAHSKTMSEFWNRAQALDTNAGLANYHFFKLINALYQARYGNLNSQSVIGAGFQHSNWSACRDVPMGKTKGLGDGSGKVLYNDSTLGDQYPVKLFGFEDLWGKMWEFRPGIRFYMDNGVRKAIVYKGNLVSNTVTSSDDAFCYELTDLLQSASGQYVSAMELGEYWDMIAKTVGGGDSTYYCDGYWAATGGDLLFVGGHADYFALCGVSYAFSDNGFSYSGAVIGARLAFYSEPTIVSGAELAAMIS